VIDEFRVQLGLLIDNLGDLFQQHYAVPNGAALQLGKRRRVKRLCFLWIVTLKVSNSIGEGHL
jgi:hypothetical protein